MFSCVTTSSRPLAKCTPTIWWVLDVPINPYTQLALASPWVTHPVVIGSTQFLHVIFLGHAFLAAATLCVLGTSRWNHGREKTLQDNKGTKHAEEEIPEKLSQCFLSFWVVSVCFSKIETMPKLCSLPPSPHFLLHHPLLHPHACSPLPLHLFLPHRILIVTSSTLHKLGVVHQPLVCLRHLRQSLGQTISNHQVYLIKLLSVTPIVRVQLFSEGEIGRLYFTPGCRVWKS